MKQQQVKPALVRPQSAYALPAPPQDLVTRLKNGDQRAWEEFVDARRRRLAGFFRKRGFRGDESDELVQDTLIQVVLSIHSQVGYDRLDSWLFAIARRVAAHHVARGKEPTKSIGTTIAVSSPIEHWDHVRDVLAKIGPLDKDLLYLSSVVGLTGPEIAGVSGLSLPAIWKRLSRAKARLRGAAIRKETAMPPGKSHEQEIPTAT